MKAPNPDGEIHVVLDSKAGWTGGDFRWLGFATHGERVILEYKVGDALIRESPWTVTGGAGMLFIRDLEVGPASTPLSLVALRSPGVTASTNNVGGLPSIALLTSNRQFAIATPAGSRAALRRGAC